MVCFMPMSCQCLIDVTTNSLTALHPAIHVDFTWLWLAVAMVVTFDPGIPADGVVPSVVIPNDPH